jgi:hypothetical protein
MNLTKKDIHTMPMYFDRYINLADDVDCIKSLENSLKELENAPINKWEALGNRAYAPGKWSVKDLLQHILDTERVFTYRITAVARGDKQQLPNYDEDMYALNAHANSRSLNDIVEELILVRKSTIALFKSFTNDMLLTEGYNLHSKSNFSVLSMAYVIQGHQRWHMKVLEEKYYGLLL